MDISIVIPAYNESQKISYDVQAAATFIHKQRFHGEVIVVDDGSTDNTAEMARSADIPASVRRNVIRLEKNTGKGMAVKTGIKTSNGDVVLFADSGTCVPYSNAIPVIERIRAGELDIVMGSRKLKESTIHRNRPWRRRFLSWLFRQAAILIVGLPRAITDSQCGFKLYKGEIARELFNENKTTGFIFELEILIRAKQLGYRVEEFPIEWSCDLDTRLKPGSEAVGILKELFKVRKIIKNKKLGNR